MVLKWEKKMIESLLLVSAQQAVNCLKQGICTEELILQKVQTIFGILIAMTIWNLLDFVSVDV